MEALRNRRKAEVLLAILAGVKDARVAPYNSKDYYEPLDRMKVVRLAKSRAGGEVSAPEIQTVLDMTVADAVGIKI